MLNLTLTDPHDVFDKNLDAFGIQTCKTLTTGLRANTSAIHV